MTNGETLAARVENEPPSRELDRAIEIHRRGLMANQSHPPFYTSRIGAAMSLNDKRWVVAHLSEIGADGLPMAVLTNGTREAKGYCFAPPFESQPALARAFAAAALRTKEEEG